MKNDTHIQHFVVPNIDAEVIRRRDMREVFTFTIDPKDAKDFDDALSFEKQEDGTFQVGVHIADVTYFVQPDTDIDKSAYEKATSIYYVDHVVPMLPEELCNNLCSLRPNEDKLTMSVIFTMDENAKVLKYKICRTVIRSNFRLAYEDARCSKHIGRFSRGCATLALLLRVGNGTQKAQRFCQDLTQRANGKWCFGH